MGEEEEGTSQTERAGRGRGTQADRGGPVTSWSAASEGRSGLEARGGRRENVAGAGRGVAGRGRAGVGVCSYRCREACLRADGRAAAAD